MTFPADRPGGPRPAAIRAGCPLARCVPGPSLACALFLSIGRVGAPGADLAAQQLQDNSFLIEEAYNQDRGMVQEINGFARGSGGRDWVYLFTQEWPLGGVRHQLSYSVPIEHHEGFRTTGLGDLLVHYRYQAVGRGSEARLFFAPRLSLLLPTGRPASGRGAGSVGVQTNLPLTLAVTPRLATHWNAGLTLVPSAQDPAGESATTLASNLGASAVWYFRPLINPLVELIWTRQQGVTGPGRTVASSSAFLNPGLRWAVNLPRRVQITVGAAYTIALNRNDDDGVFLYLSFEHPFRRLTSEEAAR
ncbi:MAG TPA: hypothetical protein VFK09_05915 [Gemmatimonadales bacterium]|nr:hypothetical protein [Gemmatimonadales bacterium]